MTQKDLDERLVEEAVEKLGEQFEVVQIFVSRYESTLGGTIAIELGTGNDFAKYGQIKQWILNEEQLSQSEEENDSI